MQGFLVDRYRALLLINIETYRYYLGPGLFVCACMRLFCGYIQGFLADICRALFAYRFREIQIVLGTEVFTCVHACVRLFCG